MTMISDENITENATDGTDDQSLVTSAVVSDDSAQYSTLALDMPASILVTSVNGWVVIQQRMDGGTSFNRTWVDYKNGFGTYNRNFWLGLENMYRITASGVYRLRFEFETITGKTPGDGYHAPLASFPCTCWTTNRSQLTIHMISIDQWNLGDFFK